MSKIVSMGHFRKQRDAATFEDRAKASFLGLIAAHSGDASHVKPLDSALLTRVDSLCEAIEANQRALHLLEG